MSAMPGPRHGTQEQYAANCKCQECKDAHAAYARRRNAERRERTPDFLRPGHGTLARYNVWECRCDLCKAHMRDRKKASR